MAGDWWDMYGSPQPQAEERQCWDCHTEVRVEALGPDGVRCVECWRGRTEKGRKRPAQQTQRYARRGHRKSLRALEET
jgi:hypothetical protein